MAGAEPACDSCTVDDGASMVIIMYSDYHARGPQMQVVIFHP
jgi:hypothetical protein